MTAYSMYTVGSAYYNGTQDQLTGWDYAAAVPGIAFTKIGGAAVKVGKALSGVEKVENVGEAISKSIDNLSSLRGASIDEVTKIIPENWVKTEARDGVGVKYINPSKKGEQIIIEKGSKNPSSPDNVHAGDYLRVSKDGKVERVPLQGNPSLKKN